MGPGRPVLLAIGATVLAALVLALRWSRDVDLLADSVRRIARGRARCRRQSPVLPGMQRLGGDLERLARRGRRALAH